MKISDKKRTYKREAVPIQMEYYSAMREKGILPFSTTWMELEHIMFSEISQTERQVLYGITYVCNLKKSNLKTQYNSGYQKVDPGGEE